MTDDQRVDDLKAMPRTRRADRGRGVTFENSYATFPLCCPSRASYLTGQYAHNHGVVEQPAPTAACRRSTTRRRRGRADAAGYRTGWVGKYLNGYLRSRNEDPAVRAAGLGLVAGGRRPTASCTAGRRSNGDRLEALGVQRTRLPDGRVRPPGGAVPRGGREDGRAVLPDRGARSRRTWRRGRSRGDHNPRSARRHRGAFEDRAAAAPAVVQRGGRQRQAVVHPVDCPASTPPPGEQLRQINRDRLATACSPSTSSCCRRS